MSDQVANQSGAGAAGGWVTRDQLSPLQRELAEGNKQGSYFLTGPAGSGKTTAAVFWANSVLQSVSGGEHLLVLVPQRSLARPYTEIPLRFPGTDMGRMTILTLASLARRMTELFWPFIAESGGFGDPSSQPRFLTLETATYFLASSIEPLLEAGLFQEVTLEKHQLYRQILDNLNKAALVGFPLDEIGPRLAEAWVGPEGRAASFDDAMHCAKLFRERCLRENLLDFSLQVEMFFEHILPLPEFSTYRQRMATYLLAENIEEDAPRTHDLIALLIPEMQASLVLYDTEAGFRRFLGADPVNAVELKQACGQVLDFSEEPRGAAKMLALGTSLAREFNIRVPDVAGNPGSAVQVEVHRHLVDATRWIVDEIQRLVLSEAVPAHEIAVVTPYLSDSLRFMLGTAFEEADLPWFAYRPSHAIRDEPASRSMLILAALAHPTWEITPGVEEVARMLSIAIEDLDPVRADLLARILYRPNPDGPWLLPFAQVRGDMQHRLTPAVGRSYELLRCWLDEYTLGSSLPIDLFMRRLFGEVLTRPGFGFAQDLTAGNVISTLVDSSNKFRAILDGSVLLQTTSSGEQYLRQVEQGVITAQDLRLEAPEMEQAVLVSPAFTFLMANRTVAYQFWMDVGSDGWGERIYQPLTHPYVLSRQWTRRRPWTDADEAGVQDTIAGTLALGLTRRCSERVYALWNEVDEGGFEQRGPMLRALYQVLRSEKVAP